jgi:Fur family transcriptional regulator, ferric uptake regulator
MVAGPVAIAAGPVDSPAMDADIEAPDYDEMLRAAGLRITRPRRVILEILHTAEGHPDALAIYAHEAARREGISLATVYRTVKALEESGAVQRHAFAGGPARFEQAGEEHHDHLIDLDTGEVIEFSSNRIEAIQEEIAARLGYEIVHHRLELYGRKRR